MTDADVAAQAAVDQSDGAQVQASAAVETPSDDEVAAVAQAMDVDGKIDWKNTVDHDVQIAIEAAKAEARRFIIGCRAVGIL